MKGTRTLVSIVVLVAVAAGAAILTGCSAADRGQTGVRRPEAPAQVLNDAAPAAEADQLSLGKTAADGQSAPAATTVSVAAGGTVSNLPQERMVIKTATLAVRVRDVASAFQRAVQLAESGGGYVQTSTQSEEGGERADLTIRVPPNGFLPLLSSLGALGTVTTKTIGGEDVTQEYYDLGAELDNETEVRGRLFVLLSKSVKVADAIAVEEQLERVGANVNRIKGRMKYLQTMTGLSTLDVSLYGEERAQGGEGFINWSFIGHGFWRAAQILVQVFFGLLQFLVVAIPLLLVGGAAAWGVVLLARRVRTWRGLPGLRGSAQPPSKPGPRK